MYNLFIYLFNCITVPYLSYPPQLEPQSQLVDTGAVSLSSIYSIYAGHTEYGNALHPPPLSLSLSPCSGVIDTHPSHISPNVSYSRMGPFFPRAGQPGYRVVPHTPLTRLILDLRPQQYLYSVIKTPLFFKKKIDQ